MKASVNAITIRDLRREFDVKNSLFGKSRHITAVDGVSLSVPFGSVFGIVGESGCGKSTLARVILGLLKPTSGEVLIDDMQLSDLDRRARASLIQPVFQDPYSSLNPRQSIRNIVALPLTSQGNVAASDIIRRVDEMLERVGIAVSMAHRRPAELSGGQRQRVAIARALVLRPRIVVCDEPTSALDVSVQAQILNLLAELRRELGLTYVFISHNLAVVQHIADCVAVMYLGRIVEAGETEQLFAEPRHPYTQALLASVLTPEPGLGVPDVGLGNTSADPSNIPAGCRFHPRCRIAEARCRVEQPRPRFGANGGTVECHLASGTWSESSNAMIGRKLVC